jgi:transposase InsO family protein
MPVKVWLGDNSYILAIGEGSVDIELRVGNQKISGKIQKVLHVPDLHGNLLSVSYLTQHGLKVAFEVGSVCRIYSIQNLLIGEAHLEGNIYILNADVVLPEQIHLTRIESGMELELKALTAAERNSKADLNTWHRRLGHISVKSVLKMVQKGMVKGMEISKSKSTTNVLCEPCIQGKQSRAPIPKSTKGRKVEILARIHSDICGKMQTKSRQGYEYFMTFIDDASRLVSIAFLKQKSEALSKTKEFVERAEAETGARVVMLRTDGGGEYSSQESQEYLKLKGIKHETTNAYTPQENGVAERMNRTLVESARSLLNDAGLPNSYWADAVEYAANI